MARKITIKSLEQAYKLRGQQLTVQSLLNGNIYHKDRGWISVNICQDLRNQIADTISEMLGGHGETRHRINMKLRDPHPPQHWGLDRMLLVKYGKDPVRISYCVGQEQTWELREIRKSLKA